MLPEQMASPYSALQKTGHWSFCDTNAANCYTYFRGKLNIQLKVQQTAENQDSII